jgi:predicted GIY-YIG superfamily endonuclease
MEKGIIYVMTTAVDGIVKIGMTTNFENRMDELERNGYYNVSGLKRKFAIEVEDFEDKEKLIHD